MPLPCLTLSYQDLAVIFRRKPTHIGATISRWMREEHFPPPLPGTPRLWSTAAVTAWIDAADAGARKAAKDVGLVKPGEHRPDAVEAWRKKLEAKFGVAPGIAA